MNSGPADDDAYIGHFSDVLITPYEHLLDGTTADRIHVGGPDWPDWARQGFARHCRSGRPADARPTLPAAEPDVVDELAWAGPIAPHFGHQVVEFSMRLLDIAERLPQVDVAFATKSSLGWRSMDEAPPFQSQILDWFGVHRRRRKLIGGPTVARTLYAVPQAEQLGGPGPSAGRLDRLDGIARRRLGGIDASARVATYVSRAGQVARLAGERYLEEAMRLAGVRVLRPEELSLRRQIHAYRLAEPLIVAEGSALHVMQLAGRFPSNVSVLVRRPGKMVANPLLSPRVWTLRYLEASAGVVHDIDEAGEPLDSSGVSIIDEEELLPALAETGLDLRPQWDRAAFVSSRDADVMAWIAWRATSPGQLDGRSREHVVEALHSTGLAHLAARAERQLIDADRRP